MTKPRLLDLFSGGGGAAMGYHRAGFEVVGVDINPQPHYPFEFHQADAMAYPLDGFDAIHASPPCQAYSEATAWRGSRANHPELIVPVRERLVMWGGPYVIENVAGARRELIGPVRLCGSWFGLPVRSHHYFEMPWWTDWELMAPCSHSSDDHVRDHGGKHAESEFGPAMGIDWMTVAEARQAIPPSYTQWIGERLMVEINGRAQKCG
ncbi:MAG: DNA cytosine methyltransferase [Candidatus Dormibacteria bacterium]